MTQEMQNGERLVPFMGVKILLAGSVLAPRAETELLGNAALALLGGMEGAGLLAIDMCCGSGNLCCGLASAAPQVTFLGADLTDDAVAAAEQRTADAAATSAATSAAATQEQRTFLQDGDEVSLRARSERPGFVGIGWGDCTATLGAATATPLG